MSRVYKCDECGTIYENNNKFKIDGEEYGPNSFIGGIIFETNYNIQIPTLRFTLCDECLSKLLRDFGKFDMMGEKQ